MAEDFTFSKNVSDVRGGQNVAIAPKTENRVQQIQVPNAEEAVNHLAESQNTLSSIGATVAQKSSNAIASELGFEAGKNPKNTFLRSLPDFTDADEFFRKSYNAQAKSVLSIQGQQLLDTADLQLAKSPRLNPALIANATKQLTVGLKKITDQAPEDLRPQMQEVFEGQILQQNSQYQKKMYEDNREDQKNNMLNAFDVNVKNAYELAMNGNQKAAETLIKNSPSEADNGVANRFITPEAARTYQESLKQAVLNGQYIRMAQAAKQQNKLEDFQKEYAEKKPDGMTNEQWMNTGKAVLEQMNFEETMSSHYESMVASEMLEKVVTSPQMISGTEWANFKSQVSGEKYAQVHLHYIQALKKSNTSNIAVSSLIKDWGRADSDSWALATEKQKNSAYLSQVNYFMQPHNGQQGLTHEMAEVRVAASAAAPIPVFINGLNLKAQSSNPAMIESVAQQVNTLRSMGKGNLLTGFTDQSQAVLAKYDAKRDSRDPMTAAIESHDNVFNQNPDTQLMVKNKFSNLQSTNTKKGGTIASWMAKKFSLDNMNFSSPNLGTMYAGLIFQNFRDNYDLTSGDDAAATKMTQDYIKDNFDDTWINGGKHTTFHPIEKSLGFSDPDVVPYIQQDFVDQFNERSVGQKKLFDSGHANEYYEALPATGKNLTGYLRFGGAIPNASSGIFHTTFEPIKIRQTIKTEHGVKKNTYPVVLEGNPFNTWYISIKTDSALRDLYNTSWFSGMQTFAPNSKKIRDKYNIDHQLKG